MKGVVKMSITDLQDYVEKVVEKCIAKYKKSKKKIYEAEYQVYLTDLLEVFDDYNKDKTIKEMYYYILATELSSYKFFGDVFYKTVHIPNSFSSCCVYIEPEGRNVNIKIVIT